jgi:hypothetical protein
MIKKIYLDMDGVLCNFERRYLELYDELPGSMRDRKDFNVNWDHFVQSEQFKTLDWWTGGRDLLTYITQYQHENEVEVEILSSSGGQKYHREVAEQKIEWLRDKGIPFKANIVSGRKAKAEYATPESVLIDDTHDVIQGFIAAGGIGVHHKDIGNTLMMLDKLLNRSPI